MFLSIPNSSRRIILKAGLHLAAILILTGSVSLCKAQNRSATVLLAGYKHVPPIATPGTGSVTVTLQGDSLFVEGDFSYLSSQVRGAAIYYGSRGENGNQLIRLRTAVQEDGTSGILDPSQNRFKLAPAIKNALGEGKLYILVYTERHPRGELRSQIPAMPSG